MVGTGIDRASTAEEKSDFKQLGGLTAGEVFLKKLAEVGHEFVKEHKPFDSQNAKLDYQDMIEKAEKESERVNGFILESDMMDLEFGDLTKYGKADRFEIVGKDEEQEMVVVNGQRSSIKTGVTVKYVAKERGFGVSVFMPNELYDERFGKKKVKEDKE